jgi:hypothetical protein
MKGDAVSQEVADRFVEALVESMSAKTLARRS